MWGEVGSTFRQQISELYILACMFADSGLDSITRLDENCRQRDPLTRHILSASTYYSERLKRISSD